MTRDEFRDYVDFLHSQNKISYDVYSGLIDGIDTLEQEPRWIPVSEKWPENKECVLVSLRHFTGRHTVDIGSMVFLEGIPHWHILGQSLAFNEVEAWMLPPKPYEPQEIGNEEWQD